MKRTELLKTLSLVQPAISKADIVPIFTHFMFADGKVSASNDELSIVVKDKNLKTDGLTFALHSKTLTGLLNNSSADELKLASGDENDIVIKIGKSVFKLPYLPEETFLFEEPKKEKWLVSLKINEDLLKGIETCLTTVGRDYSARAYMGICFTGKALYSSDGDAITAYRLNEGWEKRFMVPNDFCEAILKISKETDKKEGIIELNNNWAKAIIGERFSVYGRIIEVETPLDYEGEIKTTKAGDVKFFDIPIGLYEALNRARVLEDVETVPTVFSAKGKNIEILTESKHMGVIQDELPWEGDEIEVSVLASLVQRSLNVCNRMAINETCTCYSSEDGKILQLVANIGA